MKNRPRTLGRKLSPKPRSTFDSHTRHYNLDAYQIKVANRVMRESNRRARYGDPDVVAPPAVVPPRQPTRFEDEPEAIPAHKRRR